MPYCHACGHEVTYDQMVCPLCHERLNTPKPNVQVYDDYGGFGWGLLGFCVPVAGLLVYLIWKDTRPLTAGTAGTGAIIGVIVDIVIVIIFLALIASL